MAQKIEIPVSLNAQIDNLKQIRSTLINTVNAAGKESTLAKTLTKDLGKVDEQIRELESISLQPTINESEFRHIQTIFDRLTKQFQSSFTQIDLSGFEQIASEADINRLKSLTQEASKYRKELEAIQKAGSSEKTEAFLTRTNRQQLLDQGRTLKGFDSTATLNKNATAMEKAAESYRRSANELQDALDTLDQEATEASNRAKTIKDRVDNLTAQHQTLRTDSRIADFHYRAASLETNFSANSQMSNPTVGSIRSGLRRTLETVYADGKIATDAREAVSDWIKKLAPNISTTEAARMVQQDLTTLLEDLMEEIFGAGYRADNDLLYNPNHSAMLSRAQGYSRAEINRLNRKHSTATVADIGTRTKEVQQQLKQEQAEYQKINNEINKKQAKWDELDEQQSSYLNAANEASKLSQELYTLAAAEQAAAEAAKQTQIAQNEAEQNDLKNRTVSGVKGSAAPGPGQLQGLRGNLKGFGEDTGERYSGEKAAEEFKHNLQMSIRQWMSAQQIVNIIKDGLRQAIQDIQGLDKAMTNIAVVTDMSVGDLWGKINDYMSIAQQYGVTTQGVYEVSQLYYQQGLSTSEVMAATTETLKMARIAGMDYAEAADAMTVAIRAFKMEMSDAQTVTDVYSKVAAVTASDSEELAIAMSKTASSAESVGSSFENTTAMLAVMIETTRESAQNLGSALKSIISRYGEMKTGLTVDSEGEAIDYNKVDTALKSVGISIKDAQGQFRDFDDVIFELSEKWDSLDKNTQRYIATIMAGNRQQSRFIALVDNWERLDEVATAAQDSEDAGLLQYAKTLDSLETKINNIKTSFQEFYMSFLNGPVFGAALEFVNNLIKGFNKLGLLASAFNIGSIVNSVKTLGSLIGNSLSSPLSQWANNYKTTLDNFVIYAAKSGHKAGQTYGQNFQAGQQSQGLINPGSGSVGPLNSSQKFINTKGGKFTVGAASILGLGLSTAGAAIAGHGDQKTGAWLSAFGSTASGVAQGALMGGIPGAIIGGIAGLASNIPSLIKALDANTQAENELAAAREKAEEKNIERAEAKENYNNLKSLLAEYEKAQTTRYDSEANYEEWININNQLVEAYPTLLDYIDAEGNAIANVTSKTEMLAAAFAKTTDATWNYYQAKIAEIQAEIATNRGYSYSKGGAWSHKDAFKDYSSSEYRLGRENILAKYYSLSAYDTAIIDLAEKMQNEADSVTGIIDESSYLEEYGQESIDEAIALLISKMAVEATPNGSIKLSDATSIKTLIGREDADQALKKVTAEEVIDAIGYEEILRLLQLYNNWIYSGIDNFNGLEKALITYLADIGVFSGDAGEIMSIEQHAKAYGENIQLEQELQSTERAAHLSQIQGLITDNQTGENLFEKVEGHAALLYTYLTTAEELDNAALSTLTKDSVHLENAVNALAAIQFEVSKTPKLEEIFNTLYSNLSNFSLVDFIETLEKLGITETENKDFYKVYLQEWYNKNYTDMARYAQAFIPNIFEQSNLKSYETFRGEQEDSEQLRQDYAKAVEEYISSNYEQLYTFLYGNADTIIEQFSSTFADLDNTIEISGANTIGGQAAKKQKEFLEVIQLGGFANLSTLLETNAEAAAEFYSILFTDIGTQNWADALNKFAEKYEGNLFDSTILDTLVFENLSIQVQNIRDGLDTTITNWSNLAEKQTKGFTVEQADNLLNQLRTIYPEKEFSFESVFKTTSDGIIVLQNFRDTFEQLYNNEIDQINRLQSNIKGQKEVFETKLAESQVEKDEKLSIEGLPIAGVEAFLKNFGLTNNSLISTLAAQMTAENSDIKTYGDLINAINEYYEVLGSSADYLAAYKERVIKETERQDKINALYGGEAERKRISAQETIASRGAYGYTGEEVQNLIEVLGLTKDDFDLQADGTFNLDTASETLKSLDLPQYVWNAINASIEAATKSAEEGLQKLGETAAAGEKLTPVEIRGLLGDQFKGISDAGAKIIYDSFMGYLSGSVDEKTLLKELSAMHRILDSTLGYEDSLIKAKETFEEIYPEISDSADKNIADLFELKRKAIRGELTNTERATLISKIGPDEAQNLEENLEESIAAYASEIINSTEFTFEEKTSSLKKNIFLPGFDKAFGEDIGKMGETATKGIFDSRDAAADFMSKYYTILGQGQTISADDVDVSQWFSQDASGQYRLEKEISTLLAELEKAKTDANEQEINNLTKQLQYYENLQKLQRKESLASSFSSMATAEELRASELMKLYEDQGAQLTPEDALKEAERLNALNPLERFKELVKIFDGFEIDLDIETSRETANAVKVSFQKMANQVKTSAESLGSKIIAGNDELQDYMSVFGEEVPENLLNGYSHAIEVIRSGKDRLGANEAALKRAIAKNLGTDVNDKAVTDAYDALFNSIDDASYESVDAVFNAKIEALESGHLSAASKEILKSDNQGAWIDTFNAIIGGAADERAKLIFEEKAKAYNEYLAAERITEAEHLEGIAQSATDYFASLSDSIDAANQAYYAEAAEAIASGDRAYSRDELGKLYASAWKRGKVTDPDVFATEYVKSWNEAGEAILDIKKLKEADIITSRQVAEFSENLTNNVFSAAEDVINKMSSGLKVDNHEVQAIFDELGMSLKDADAEAIINGGLNTLLNRLQVELMTAGADSSDIQEKIKELQITIIDMITEALASGFSALAEGIEGTLSEASYNELQKMYGLSNSSMRTSKGVQLNQSDQQALIRGLYGKAAASGRTAGFGEELWKTLSESEDSTIKGYKDIQEEIDTITEKIGENAAATDEYVQALEAAKLAAMDAADAADFAFMEQDAYGGRADTFDKFTENVIKAKEALGTFGKGGKIAHADLSALFDVIKASPTATGKFAEAVGKTSDDVDEMLNAALRLNKLGEIDIGEVVAEWGIDIETATSALAEGMSESLKTTAQEQIKYLSGLEAMLMAMVAMEELGSTKLGLEVDITGDGKADVIYLKDVYEAWVALQDEPETKQIELVTSIQTLFNNSKATSAFLKEFGIPNQDAFSLFFPEGLDFSNEQAFKDIDLLGQIFSNIADLAPEQASAVSKGMFSALEKSLTYDAEAQKWSFGEGWQKSLLGYIQTLDWSNIPSLVDAQVSEWLSSQGKASFKIGKIEVTATENGFIIPPGSNLKPEDVSAFLEKELGITDGEAIQVETDKGIEVSFTGQPKLKTESEELKIEFESLEEAAAGIAEQTNFLQQTIATFEVSEGFREFVGLLNQITGGTQVAAETVEGAAQLANLGKEINAEGEGNGLQLKVDISEAINEFEKLQTKFEALVEVLSAPITIDIKSVGTITAGAPVVEAQSGNAQSNGTNTGVNTITTHTVQILWEVTDPDFDSIEDPTLGFNWKEPAPPVPAPAKTPTISFYWATNSTPPKYTGKPVEIPTVLKPLTSGGTSSSNGGTQQIIKEWTGTINNISGTAFADGSIGRLYSGAQFANKTLVGELGPELAVYNGEYHLLGQSGAEFVRLPNNAIVFNHKQTEGIVNGQANIRGKAMADGNVSGPALAGGSAAAALEAVRRAKSLWQGLLDDLTAAQLAGGSSGGGGGNTLKGVKEELQEWYNLSRQIADIEQEINNLIAERQNIAKKDGDAYLRSLRKEQELLERQAATQEILLGYQQLQLERQAEQINTNKIWSQFLEVDESGLLQYIKGNELNGGKGALEVLSELNEMSGEEQLKFLNNLGYTAVDQDGEKLEGQELIQKFFEELQLQIDEYDALYDTVHETEETLEDLQHKVEEINNQIIENQMDLEEDIFNILVDAWEAEIEALEEQKDLIEEANEAYIKGLNEALSAEREMYSEEQSIADREQLQRQLSLLRRSGGSASQIADLEQQLDSMLKDEYFRNQEQVIERIEDANEEQIRQLERQIRLQEEALEFEKEHGILWTKVYDIMAGSADQILNFMQGNSLEFFRQSALAQKDMLDEWSKKIGIFTENREYEKHQADSQTNVWNNGAIWNESGMSEYKQIFDSLTPEQQTKAQSLFNSTYSNARLAGDDHTTAMAKAKSTLINTLKSQKEQQAASGNKPETDLNTGSGSETWYVTGPNKLNLRDQPSKSGNRLAQLPAGTKVKVLKKLDSGWFQVEVDGKTGYVDSQFLSKGTSSSGGSGSSSSSSSNSSSSSGSSGKQYRVDYTVYFVDGQSSSGYGVGGTPEAAKRVAESYAKKKTSPKTNIHPGGASIRNIVYYDAKAYAQGGLVDYTGMAMVHGSSSKPEAFLNAKQTAMISEAVKVAGDGGALDGIRTTLNKLDATIKSIVNNNKNETTSFTVAPGAVTIQVAQLNDSYDVEELSKDVMNRMVAIASKSTNRGVNRR